MRGVALPERARTCGKSGGTSELSDGSGRSREHEGCFILVRIDRVAVQLGQ